MFSLAGLDGLITVDGRTVTLKPDPAEPGGQPEAIVLPADSIIGAVIWTGMSESRFGVQYRKDGPDQAAGPAALELMWVRFHNSEKEWWDAMASAVMKVARRAASPNAASPSAAAPGAARTTADTPPTAPPSFDGWLNRTLGLEP